jgi:hypothetical protein
MRDPVGIGRACLQITVTLAVTSFGHNVVWPFALVQQTGSGPDIDIYYSALVQDRLTVRAFSVAFGMEVSSGPQSIVYNNIVTLLQPSKDVAEVVGRCCRARFQP